MAGALVVGAGVASGALWYYSRRYVGELALLRGPPGAPPRLRLSVLDFWGNREVCGAGEGQGLAAGLAAGLAGARATCAAPAAHHTPTLPSRRPPAGQRHCTAGAGAAAGGAAGRRVAHGAARAAAAGGRGGRPPVLSEARGQAVAAACSTAAPARRPATPCRAAHRVTCPAAALPRLLAASVTAAWSTPRPWRRCWRGGWRGSSCVQTATADALVPRMPSAPSLRAVAGASLIAACHESGG